MRNNRFITVLIIAFPLAILTMRIVARNNPTFYDDFWPNLFSDFFIGAGLGTILAIWISKEQSKSEQEQKLEEDARNRTTRTVRYLKLLKRDFDNIYPELEQWINSIKSSREGYEPITGGDIPRFEYRFWDVVQQSGELPSLLDPDIVRSLTDFYGGLTDARLSIDWALQGWKITGGGQTSVARMKRFGRRTLESLEASAIAGNSLNKQLTSEIARLEDKISSYRIK